MGLSWHLDKSLDERPHQSWLSIKRPCDEQNWAKSVLKMSHWYWSAQKWSWK
jgi:hypothetical protein